MKFKIDKEFMLNNKPIKIISGAIHYFRVIPEYWEDRIIKLKAMGCNTVETYVAWNIHEPYEGQFNFSNIANIKEFIRLCSKHKLMVILRLSPYICAEWEFGGIPGWILKYDDLKIRSNNKRFLKLVDIFYSKIMKEISDLQCTRGGNIIMMQIENEYGSFSNDKKYLNKIKGIMSKNGIDVYLFTSDGPWDNLMENGYMNDVLPTGNFGSRAEERFDFQKKYLGNNKPLMCMEFWDGWFDVWGDETHHIRDYKEVGIELNNVLNMGSVNIYMFHGGTNFGFYNGSNYKDKLLSRVTSYDYDAPLSEHGGYTDKYFEFKNIIGKYINNDYELPTVNDTFMTNEFKVTKKYNLLENISHISKSKLFSNTKNMEQLDQSLGYILYECNYNSILNIESNLKLLDANDRAHIFHNDKLISILDNDKIKNVINFKMETGINNFKILIENQGRVNYGTNMQNQKKGITTGVELNKIMLSNFNHYNLELNNLSLLKIETKNTNGPTFNSFKFVLDNTEIKDTFIDCSNYGKGSIFVNGFNLGRYWNIGPQQNLYLPKHLLNIGKNEIIIFETEDCIIENIYFVDKPCL